MLCGEIRKMQILINLLRVIFMLSTIVAMTDCCSSRILLLREHTLKLVQEHDFLTYDNAEQQPIQMISEDVNMINEIDFNKSFVSAFAQPTQVSVVNEGDDDSLDGATTVTATPEQLPTYRSTEENSNNSNITHEQHSTPILDRPTLALDLTSSTALPDMLDTTNSSHFITDVTVATDATVREQHAGNPKHHGIDYYYAIMSDVLSFECNGQYLTDFCLNGGRCFRYPVGNHSFFSCECADGYVGERCESKSLNELYVPSPMLDTKPPKVLMARIVFSFPMLIAISVIYMIFGAIVVFKCPQQTRAASMLVE